MFGELMIKLEIILLEDLDNMRLSIWLNLWVGFWMCWVKLNKLNSDENFMVFMLVVILRWKLKLFKIRMFLEKIVNCFKKVENLLKNKVRDKLFVIDGGGW